MLRVDVASVARFCCGVVLAAAFASAVIYLWGTSATSRRQWLRAGVHVCVASLAASDRQSTRQNSRLPCPTMNLSGTLNAWRAVMTPRLVRPHVVVPQFSDITFPLSKFIAANVKGRWGIDVQPDIRAVVIDKDNCIAKAKSLDLVEDYKAY